MIVIGVSPRLQHPILPRKRGRDGLMATGRETARAIAPPADT